MAEAIAVDETVEEMVVVVQGGGLEATLVPVLVPWDYHVVPSLRYQVVTPTCMPSSIIMLLLHISTTEMLSIL